MASQAALFLAVFALIRGASAQNLPLSGTALRCCVIEEAPYIMPDPARPEFGNWSGLAIDYFERLQSRTGIRCESITSYTRYYALGEQFGVFSGFVDRFASCAKYGSSVNCECDLGLAAFSLSSKRLAAVDFVAPFSGESYRVLTTTSLVKSTSSNKFFFVRTFSGSVWLAIFALLVMHVVVTAMDSKFAPPRGASAADGASRRERLRHFVLKKPILFRIRHSFYNSLIHMVGQTDEMDTHKSGTKEKIMNLLALVIGLFLFTIFQASVTYQCLLDVPKSKFRSVSDFKTCQVPPNDVCLLSSGASRAYWDQVIAPASCISGDRSRSPKLVDSFKDGFSKVLGGECDYFFTLGGQINWQVNGRYCNTLATVGKPFFYTSVGFVLPKASNLTNPLTVATLQLRQEGQLMNSTGYTSVFTCNPKSNPSLGWDRLQIFFYLVIVALLGMLVVVLSSRISSPATVEASSRHTLPSAGQEDSMSMSAFH